MSLKIKDNLVVTMHYKLTDDNGNILDSSEGESPLAYIHGADNMVPGLEKALDDKKSGDTLKVRVEPGQGYGEILPELIRVLDREAFKEVEPLEVGLEFNAQGEDGNVQHILVKKIEDDKVTIDANHPFAGKNLNFDIDVISVREPTEEELDHGHVHDGDCQH